jgi:hypothetical protein
VTRANKIARRPIAQHSSGKDDWGTGRAMIDIARAVLGYISVDPFSSAKWNAVIGAERFITQAQDGYATPWVDHPGCPAPGQALLVGAALEVAKLATDRWGAKPIQAPSDLDPQTALVNPPGDKSGKNVQRAWYALDQYHRTGWMSGGALYVGFTMNQLQTLQNAADDKPDEDAARTPLHAEFLRCVPDRRVPFQSAPGVDEPQPTHPSWLLLMPSLDVFVADRQRTLFTLLCRPLGDVF